MKNQKGFSLIELLVVVIIIAIIAAIAIPNLLASRRAANESSAISTLRTYHSSQATFFATQGGGQNYGTAVELGPGAGNAGLVDATLGVSPATKSGYGFTTTQADVVAGPPLVPSTYCTVAAPQSTGALGTGTNFYGVSVDGIIYRHTAALTCAAGVLTVAGTPIQ